MPSKKPRIVMIVPRGEAVRNFLYSETLSRLARDAEIVLLSVVEGFEEDAHIRPYVSKLVPLREHEERYPVTLLRGLITDAHFRWLWSGVARNNRETADARPRTFWKSARYRVWKAVVRSLAFRPVLEELTRLENDLAWRLRPTREFDALFEALQPDLVFNCSHIHGPAGELPCRVARRMGIPVAGFIFSWDNLTSRSRIIVPYDHYLVWHEGMKRTLLAQYPFIDPARVHVTGTPQFDFHFRDDFLLPREELCRRIGIDPALPYILYTTGVDRHFPEEHLHVRAVIDILRDPAFPVPCRLVVRTYVKGTSREMRALAAEQCDGVVFPPVEWDERWYTPSYGDLSLYTSLLRHAAMGINAASTVSLELLMFGKPVVNIGFDPPGSSLPRHLRWRRHIEFDHYAPVASSGAVMVANSADDMRAMIRRGLLDPENGADARKRFIREMFGDTLDGKSGSRVASVLLRLAGEASERKARLSGCA
ncbi:MAG: hypothetical protein QHI48_03895 [Bacteroidota bacterium]|nr:hypothetical protein [Bacteroidota bacterium]